MFPLKIIKSQSVFVEEKMMDRYDECSSNDQKNVSWKDIKVYEGKYKISAKGEVQYWDDNKKEWKTKAIKKTTKKNRYPRVKITKSGKIELKCVHRLVAEAFIDNPEKRKLLIIKIGRKVIIVLIT